MEKSSAQLEKNVTVDVYRCHTAVVGSGAAGMEFAESQFRQYYLGNPKAVSLYTIPSSTPGSISTHAPVTTLGGDHQRLYPAGGGSTRFVGVTTALSI